MSSTRITWQDTLLLPEDGKRYEAIDGDLYVTPAPSLRHQWISAELGAALRRLLVEPGYGRVFHAPIGVEFPGTEEGVQPDIVFVSNARSEILVPAGIRGAPDLVIEIGSPRTAERDRTVKRKLYERQGVTEYWFVDPAAEMVEVWDFEGSGSEPGRYSDRVPVDLHGQTLGWIDLEEIFPTDI